MMLFKPKTILLLALLWSGLVLSRKCWIMPRCQAESFLCMPEQLLFIDQVALNWFNNQADFYSYVTEYSSGFFAIIVLLCCQKSRKKLLFDLKKLLLNITLNGIFLELIHIFTQRPRPYIIKLFQATQGTQFGSAVDYTSFYSGHTSFSAVCCIFTCYWAYQAQVSKSLQTFIWILSILLILSTAILRVIAGRHYPTDVLAGAIAGFFIAWITTNASYQRIPP